MRHAEFVLEDLSGQNNSLISDMTALAQNSHAAGVTVRTRKVQVETVSIDHFCVTEKLIPSVVKIDVEGAELMVLQGMDDVLRQAMPILIVEYGAGVPRLMMCWNTSLCMATDFWLRQCPRSMASHPSRRTTYFVSIGTSIKT